MSEANAPVPAPFSPERIALTGLAGLGAAFCLGGAAQAAQAAQTIFNNGGGFNSGFNASALSTAVGANLSVAAQTPAGGLFSTAGGATQTGLSGVGTSGLTTAVGANFSVVTEGSSNQALVNASQVNNGDVSANEGLNGHVNLDAP